MATHKESLTHLSQSVGQQDHTIGPADAVVTLVEYGDFQCPYAREGTRIAIMFQEKFKPQMRFVFRHFPLRKHPDAQHAAEAAEAAAAQGKFWEMAGMLFANQSRLTDRDLVKYAEKLGLDGEAFKRDLSAHTYAKDVEADVLSGTRSGVAGTPTFFINDQLYQGEDDLETLIRTVLRRAQPRSNHQSRDGEGSETYSIQEE